MIIICPLIWKNTFIFNKLLTYERILFWTQNYLMTCINMKNKGKNTQLLHLSQLSLESHNSKGVFLTALPAVTLQVLWTIGKMAHSSRTTPIALWLSHKHAVLRFQETKLKTATDQEQPLRKGLWWQTLLLQRQSMLLKIFFPPRFSQVLITKP